MTKSSEMQERKPRPEPAPGRPLGAAEVAMDAKRQLAAITGLDVDHVSGIEREDTSWRVTVDVIELKRIPAATDVLAAYDAILDETGRLLSYQRTRRYFRDQMLEAS
jgi:hypothetical protein